MWKKLYWKVFSRKIEKCKITPVILDLINEKYIDNYINKFSKRKIQTEVAVRLHNQAYSQGAVLTYADTAAIMRLSPSAVDSYIREYEKNRKSVPRRGNVHDMGTTLTQKREICIKHLWEAKGVEKTARETFHSHAAVDRYANDFKRVKVAAVINLIPGTVNNSFNNFSFSALLITILKSLVTCRILLSLALSESVSRLNVSQSGSLSDSSCIAFIYLPVPRVSSDTLCVRKGLYKQRFDSLSWLNQSPGLSSNDICFSMSGLQYFEHELPSVCRS